MAEPGDGPVITDHQRGYPRAVGGHELLTMLRAKADGLTMPAIARLFWRPSLVEAEWHAGGWMHARLKRRLRRARATMKRYRDIAAGR